MAAASSERDESAVIADAIRAELSLGSGVTRFASGSVPVFAAGAEHVVKMFPPGERSFFETERAALARIHGALSIPTPRLVAAGERDGWWYVVMTRLPGRSLAEAWRLIVTHERHRLMRDVGAALAELHALAIDDLAPLAVDWPRFVDAQRTSCRERQLARGLGSPWVNLLDDFLARWTPTDAGRRVLLHTELMREHLLVEHREGNWVLSGLVDFEPAMVGAPEYELASVGIFVTCAEPGLLRVLLDAYGAQLDAGLPLRILVYVLLHRYSNLRWYLERLPVPSDAGDLESLARGWFTP